MSRRHATTFGMTSGNLLSIILLSAVSGAVCACAEDVSSEAAAAAATVAERIERMST